jgi:hypothetical protein
VHKVLVDGSELVLELGLQECNGLRVAFHGVLLVVDGQTDIMASRL